MKKRILSIILSLVLIIGAAPLVFAETVSPDNQAELTEQQKTDREAFLKAFEEQKKTLEGLNEQEKTLVTENNNLSKEIKTILQGKYKDKADEIKGVGKEIKALAEQARKLNKERISLKAKGKSKKNTVENLARITEINNEIKDIRAEIASINNGHKKDKEELKALKASVQDLLNKEKEIRKTIEEKREEKEACWESFKAAMEKMDYKTAGDELTKIVQLKKDIVELLTQRQAILKDILAALN